MMGRFCRYLAKVFDFGQRISHLRDRMNYKSLQPLMGLILPLKMMV
jgi:hypothetical protein